MNQLNLHRDFSLLEAMGNALNPEPSKPLEPTANLVTLHITADSLIDFMVSEIGSRWNRSVSQYDEIDQQIIVSGVKIDIQAEWRISYEYDDLRVRAYDFQFQNDQIFWMDGEPVRFNEDIMDEVYESIMEQLSDEFSK